MEKLLLLISLLFISISVIAEHKEGDPKEYARSHHHPIFPIVLGAGLITWGAYELGNDADDGQRNVAILWGGGLLASAGIVLYQSRNKETAQISFQPTVNKGHSVAFNYRF